MVFTSKNITVRTIRNIAHAPLRVLINMYAMTGHNVDDRWNKVCDCRTELISVCTQLCVLLETRDYQSVNRIFNEGERRGIIDFLCTG